MRKHFEKIGSAGAVLAAAACPVCFPKLALIGAALGLGGLGAYELQFFIAAQVLVALVMVGSLFSFRRHRKPWLVAGVLVSGALVFVGIYLAGEALSYAGLAGLVGFSSADLLMKWRRPRASRDCRL